MRCMSARVSVREREREHVHVAVNVHLTTEGRKDRAAGPQMLTKTHSETRKKRFETLQVARYFVVVWEQIASCLRHCFAASLSVSEWMLLTRICVRDDSLALRPMPTDSPVLSAWCEAAVEKRLNDALLLSTCLQRMQNVCSASMVGGKRCLDDRRGTQAGEKERKKQLQHQENTFFDSRLSRHSHVSHASLEELPGSRYLLERSLPVPLMTPGPPVQSSIAR